MGLVNEVVPTGTRVERAKKVTRKISDFPSDYLTYHKPRVFQSISVPMEYAISQQQRFPPEENGAYGRDCSAA